MMNTTRSTFANRIRIAAGALLVVVGVPLFVLPIPLGILLIVPGVWLLLQSSSWFRRKFARLRRCCPKIYKPIASRLHARSRRRRQSGSGSEQAGPKSS
jgi:uncharacterized membrane protein